MNTLKECFDTILHGNENNSRLAARKVRKLVYSSTTNRDKCQNIKNLITAAPDNYAKISEDWRQENFVTTVSVMYFMHDREEQPDFLFPWLFQLLQHPNGVIRYAAINI